jgi:phage/plasmid-like protein (TIGR03299 family)
VSVEVPDTIKTPEGVEYRPNLLAVTSFDGSLATTYKRVITNVVCDNTMAAGLSESGQLYKRKHTRNSAGTLQIAEAREALAIVHTMSEDFEAEVKALTQWEITDKEWFTFLEKHVPDTDPKTGKAKEKAALTKVINQRDQLTGMYRNDMRVAPWAGTAWGVLQAVNTYVHHESTFKGGNRVERNMDRMVSSSKTESVFALDSGVIQTLATVTGKELVMA